MRLLANAKVNWALSVLGRREDGYHELDMIMQSVSLCDTLTIRPADSLFLRARGALVPGDDNNLVLKAARVLRGFLSPRDRLASLPAREVCGVRSGGVGRF